MRTHFLAMALLSLLVLLLVCTTPASALLRAKEGRDGQQTLTALQTLQPRSSFADSGAFALELEAANDDFHVQPRFAESGASLELVTGLAVLGHLLVSTFVARFEQKLLQIQSAAQDAFASVATYSQESVGATTETLKWALAGSGEGLNAVGQELGFSLLKALPGEGLVSLAERALKEQEGSGVATELTQKVSNLAAEAKRALASGGSQSSQNRAPSFLTVIDIDGTTTSTSGPPQQSKQSDSSLPAAVTALRKELLRLAKAQYRDETSASSSAPKVKITNPLGKQQRKMGSMTASTARTGTVATTNNPALKVILPPLDRLRGLLALSEQRSQQKRAAAQRQPTELVEEGIDEVLGGRTAPMGGSSLLPGGSDNHEGGGASFGELHELPDFAGAFELANSFGVVDGVLDEATAEAVGSALGMLQPAYSLLSSSYSLFRKRQQAKKAPAEAALALGLASEQAHTAATLSRFATCSMLWDLRDKLRETSKSLRKQAKAADKAIRKGAVDEARALASPSSSSQSLGLQAQSQPVDGPSVDLMDATLARIVGKLPELGLLGYKDKLLLYRRTLYKTCSFTAPLLQRIEWLFDDDKGFCKPVTQEFPPLPPRSGNGGKDRDEISVPQTFVDSMKTTTSRTNGKPPPPPPQTISQFLAGAAKTTTAASSSGTATIVTRCKKGQIVDVQVASTNDAVTLSKWFARGYSVPDDDYELANPLSSSFSSLPQGAKALKIKYRGDLAFPAGELLTTEARGEASLPGWSFYLQHGGSKNARMLLILRCEAVAAQVKVLLPTAVVPPAYGKLPDKLQISMKQDAGERRTNPGAALQGLTGSSSQQQAAASTGTASPASYLSQLSKQEQDGFWLRYYLELARLPPISAINFDERGPSNKPVVVSASPLDVIAESLVSKDHSSIASNRGRSGAASAVEEPVKLYITRSDALAIADIKLIPLEPVIVPSDGNNNKKTATTSPVAASSLSSSWSWIKSVDGSLYSNEKKATQEWQKHVDYIQKELTKQKQKQQPAAGSNNGRRTSIALNSNDKDGLGKAAEALERAREEGDVFPTALAAPPGCTVNDRIFLREKRNMIVKKGLKWFFRHYVIGDTSSVSTENNPAHSLELSCKPSASNVAAAEELQTLWERVPMPAAASDGAASAAEGIRPHLWVKRVLALSSSGEANNNSKPVQQLGIVDEEEGDAADYDVSTDSCFAPAPANYLFVDSSHGSMVDQMMLKNGASDRREAVVRRPRSTAGGGGGPPQ
jgi:hypothetical protein